MANAQVQGQITLAAAQALLTRPNKFRFLNPLNQFSFNYITAMEHLQEKLSIPATACDTADGKITTMVLDPVDLSVQITNISKVGNNLILTLAEDKGEYFRMNFTVANDSAEARGYVSARTQNTITLSPLSGITLATTDFTVGGYANEGVQLVPVHGSDKVEGREIMPRLVENLLPLYRANREFSRRDNTTMTYIQEALGTARRTGNFASVESALVNLQLNDMSYDIMKQMEFDAIFGIQGEQTINNRLAMTPMGFKQSVDERGGIGYDTTTPITFNKHKSLIKDIFANYNGVEQEILCFAGSNYISRVEDGGQTYKVTAGKQSVLEGSGLSFNSVETIFGRITYVPLALFNDPNKFKGLGSTGNRALSESALLVSVTTMKDYNGNPLAPVQKHYGSYGGNGPGMYFTQTNGICDIGGKFVMNSPSQIDGAVVGQVCEEVHVIANAQPLGYYMVS